MRSLHARASITRIARRSELNRGALTGLVGDQAGKNCRSGDRARRSRDLRLGAAAAGIYRGVRAGRAALEGRRQRVPVRALVPLSCGCQVRLCSPGSPPSSPPSSRASPAPPDGGHDRRQVGRLGGAATAAGSSTQPPRACARCSSSCTSSTSRPPP